MQVGSASSAGLAFEQIARSIQSMNDLNSQIVDSNQELSGKFLKMNVEEKVQDAASDSQVDLLA